MKHGRGEIVYKNGDKYIGEYMNDMKHGYGKFEFSQSGLVYYGQWSNDQINGIGTLSGTNNQFYNGEWKDGKYHGKGQKKYKEGSTYDG